MQRAASTTTATTGATPIATFTMNMGLATIPASVPGSGSLSTTGSLYSVRAGHKSIKILLVHTIWKYAQSTSARDPHGTRMLSVLRLTIGVINTVCPVEDRVPIFVE